MFNELVDFVTKTWTLLYGLFVKQGNVCDVGDTIEEYNDLHNKSDLDDRNSKYMSLVNLYYNVATIFYEWGWGQSFHFANRHGRENFWQSLIRHEHYLAHRLGAQKGEKVIDVGCGVGGPMRAISRFTGAHVIGINNNAYQISRGMAENKKVGLDKQCSFKKADFMKLPFEENSLDGAYAIEATCHAPDRHGVFGEIYRCLKPGQKFVGYEWCMTDKHDPKNPEHLTIKKEIETGDGLPDICHTSEIDRVLKNVGFEVLDSEDLAEIPVAPGGYTWYYPLEGSYFDLKRIQHTHYGRLATDQFLRTLEWLRIAPKGTVKVSQMLNYGANGLANGGRLHTFTPMYFFEARKPLNATE